MTVDEKLLLRLVAMKLVWPRGPGLKIFKSENHLDRKIEEVLERVRNDPED